MKNMLISGIAFLLLFAAVVGNSLWIHGVMTDVSDRLSETEAAEEYDGIYRDFRKKERFISLTVSHEDLTNIENAFAELIAAAGCESREDEAQIKSRLQDSLEHLKRLSELSADSIF